jgi:hypothetical protein
VGKGLTFPSEGEAIEEWTTPTYCTNCGKLVFRTNPPLRQTLRGKNGGKHICEHTKRRRAGGGEDGLETD